MTAKARVINFERVKDGPPKVDAPRGPGERITKPISSDGKVLTPKQIRTRARRALKSTRRKELLTQEEFNALYKPIEEWDLEELGRGRPRNAKGDFSGRSPSWVTRQVHEQAQERFKNLVKTELNSHTVTALDTLQYIMGNQEVDDKGKPIVPASVKLQAAQFLIEHTVGKPKQEIQNDVSVKLQGILGVVMANPNDALASGAAGGKSPDAIEPAYKLGYYPPAMLAVANDEELEGEVEDG